jgi:hypothetical protein
VTGRRAFKRDTAAETITAILREEPPDLMGVSPRSPRQVAKTGIGNYLSRSCVIEVLNRASIRDGGDCYEVSVPCLW